MKYRKSVPYAISIQSHLLSNLSNQTQVYAETKP